MFVFTKTIRLFALQFYEAIVSDGEAFVNYHLILRNFEPIISLLIEKYMYQFILADW